MLKIKLLLLVLCIGSFSAHAGVKVSIKYQEIASVYESSAPGKKWAEVGLNMSSSFLKKNCFEPVFTEVQNSPNEEFYEEEIEYLGTSMHDGGHIRVTIRLRKRKNLDSIDTIKVKIKNTKTGDEFVSSGGVSWGELNYLTIGNAYDVNLSKSVIFYTSDRGKVEADKAEVSDVISVYSCD